jgi:hypothetical protein
MSVEAGMLGWPIAPRYLSRSAVPPGAELASSDGARLVGDLRAVLGEARAREATGTNAASTSQRSVGIARSGRNFPRAVANTSTRPVLG